MLYPVTSTSVFHGDSSDFHPNLVAGTLQSYASDVNIYSVGYGKFSDIEWALINLDIHLINGSINYGSYSAYSNDPRAKWFDAIVSTHNVTLIASGGNSESWQSNGWPRVISPSSGYNSIAVGAYSANGNSDSDRMYNYRYNPITGTDLVNYKPDIVIAAPSTSEASPALSGIAAMMIQLKPSLAVKPELIKAILMASCHRKVLPVSGTLQENMEDGMTERQGAGAVDAYRALCIIALGNYGVNSITTGSTDINIGQLGTSNDNVNVSLAWLRNNTYTHGNYNISVLGTLQELELRVLSNAQIKGTSAKTNTGKQMVYFSSSSDDHTIRVTKASQNTEPVSYAFAWSIENSTFDLKHQLAAATDLTFDNAAFHYTTIRFSDSFEFFNGRNLYVVIKKYNSSGVIFTSPIYTVAMNAFSTGTLTHIATSARSFAESEYIEILMYSDSATPNLISRQLLRPVVFDMSN